MKSHTHTQQGTFSSGGPSKDSTGDGGVDHTHSISHSHDVSVLTDDEVWYPVTAYGAGIGNGLGILNKSKMASSGSTSSISTSTSGKATVYKHTHSLSNHTHSTTISGQTSSNDSGATETRPKNYTYIIWKRIA